MDSTIRILLLEDSDDDAELLHRELRKAGLDVEIRRVETESAYREQLREFSPRVVLADLALPRYDGRLALRLLREESPETPFIFVSGSRGEELAIEALKQGATDYVLKHRLERLAPAVLRALNESSERDRRVEAESQLQLRLRYENATSKCLQILAAGEPDLETLTRVLRSLRETAQASRVYLFRHDRGDGQGPGGTDVPTMNQVAEVVAAGIEPQIDNPEMQGLPYEKAAPTLLAKLLAREPYGGTVSDLPDPERDLLEAQDILSALALPIFCDGELWGFIGFDDCLRQRRWAAEDVNVLQVVADMIGIAMHRKRSVDELRLQAAVMNAAANAIVITDPQGHIRWVNPAWTRLTGYAAEESVGRNMRILKSGVHDDSFYRELWETIRRGRVWESEMVNRRKDGSFYSEHATITPVKDGWGAITHYVAIKEDISKRKQMEQKLAALNTDLERRIEERTARLSESERFNRATLDALSAHVAVVDPEGTIVAVNQAWRRFAEENGADSHTVSEGANYLTVCDQAAAAGNLSAARAAEALRRLIRGDREHWDLEYPCHGPAARRWFYCRAIRFLFEGEPRVLVAHENVTPMKESEEALREAKAAAEKASNAKSEFLAAMSHELRTPLNGILGMNELLLSGDLNEKQRQFVELSSTSGRLLLQLINDILDLSKIEAGKLELELRPTDIEVLVYRVVDILNPTATRKGLKLSCNVNLDACVTAMCDGNRLQQVLVNLISNAIKFTRDGEITVHVDRFDQGDQHGESAAVSARLRFRVTDTGIGIPSDRQNRLFLRFSQVDSSTTREFGGTGLGLSICREIVELMRGRIGVESRVGEGSTFWFEFPAEVSATHARFTEYRRLLRGTRILAIDGLDRDRKHVAECLRSWGCEFVQVPDVAAAIASEHAARASGRPFEVVFADCRLVTGNEYNQLQQLADVPDIEIIGFGTPAEDSLRSYLYALGIKTLLFDPVRPSGLYEALSAAVWNRSQRGSKSAAGDEDSTGAKPPTAAPGRADSGQHAATKRDTAADQPLASATPATRDTPATRESPLRGRVLVAEDNRINQMYIMELLKTLGLTADLATNGEEACAAVQRERYDLVLMDCQMPQMDGFDATRKIRQLESTRGDERVPVVALTANAMVEDRDRCLAAGMDDYLAKPVDAAKVRSMLSKFLAADPASD